MKKRLFIIFIAAIFVVSCALACTACNKVTPCAWVAFGNEGYIYYTADMYGDHIIYYEDETDAEGDTYHANYAISISFIPRILGKSERNGVVCTTVEVSKHNSMTVYINKGKSTYDPNKKVYLNGTALTPSRTNDNNPLLCLTFDISLERGNPGGKENDKLNIIEYK